MNNIEITTQGNEIIVRFGAKMVLLLGLAILVELILKDKLTCNKTVKVICSIAAPLVLGAILFANEFSFIQETFGLANDAIENLLN